MVYYFLALFEYISEMNKQWMDVKRRRDDDAFGG